MATDLVEKRLPGRISGTGFSSQLGNQRLVAVLEKRRQLENPQGSARFKCRTDLELLLACFGAYAIELHLRIDPFRMTGRAVAIRDQKADRVGEGGPV